MFKKALQTITLNRLQKKYRNPERNVLVHTFKTAKTAAILWYPEDDGAMESFEHMRKVLTEHGISARGLAVVGTTEEKETFSKASHSRFFTGKEIDWRGNPKSDDLKNFVNTRYDLLLDLSISELLPLQSILVNSLASFKVGWKEPENNFYDLNVEITGKKNCRYLTEQIIHYLEYINRKG
jgi:hypothetical protein